MNEDEENEDEDKELEALTQLVKNAVTRLLEHVQTVQIFVTTHKPDGKETATQHFSWGEGNWFARYGQIQRWMILQDKIFREE